MREIKFRAWDKNRNRFTSLGLLIDLDGYVFQPYFQNIQRVHVELSQYTGLKDKNGKEIYEGDIVTTDIFQSLNGGQVECRFTVEWKDKSGMWGLGNRGMATAFILSEISMWKVIGNIYENPELIPQE